VSSARGKSTENFGNEQENHEIHERQKTIAFWTLLGFSV